MPRITPLLVLFSFACAPGLEQDGSTEGFYIDRDSWPESAQFSYAADAKGHGTQYRDPSCDIEGPDYCELDSVIHMDKEVWVVYSCVDPCRNTFDVVMFYWE